MGSVLSVCLSVCLSPRRPRRIPVIFPGLRMVIATTNATFLNAATTVATAQIPGNILSTRAMLLLWEIREGLATALCLTMVRAIQVII